MEAEGRQIEIDVVIGMGCVVCMERCPALYRTAAFSSDTSVIVHVAVFEECLSLSSRVELSSHDSGVKFYSRRFVLLSAMYTTTYRIERRICFHVGAIVTD